LALGVVRVLVKLSGFAWYPESLKSIRIL